MEVDLGTKWSRGVTVLQPKRIQTVVGDPEERRTNEILAGRRHLVSFGGSVGINDKAMRSLTYLVLKL